MMIIVPSTVSSTSRNGVGRGETRDEFRNPVRIGISFVFNSSTRAIMVNVIACTISPAVMILIFAVRRKLIARISQAKNIDKRHHEFIARALTYQLTLPCWVAVGATFWLCDLAQVWNSEFTERLLMVMFSVFSLASPIINFTMLPPYRSMIP
ncbi:hypothetical protein PENTCL1PPCAC_15199, partial [Pristionchus entomophagus]